MYQFVEHLCAAGLDARVVQARHRFRPDWFRSTAPVVGARASRVLAGDVVIIPEIWGHLVDELAGLPLVLLNQNPFLARDEHVPSDDLLATVVVSEHSRRFCELAYPGLPVERIRLGVPAVRSMPKRRRIAFMPRRGGHTGWQLIRALERSGRLAGWEVVAIDDLPAAEVSRQLSTSSVFLSLSNREGFGLPPLEAMAAGCVVVGYHGQAGREYFDPRWSFPVEDDDIVTFLGTLNEILDAFDRDAEAMMRLGERAAHMAARRFTLEQQAADTVEVFTRLAELAAGRGPTEPARLQVPRSTRDRLRRRVKERLVPSRETLPPIDPNHGHLVE